MNDLEFIQKCAKGDKQSWDQFIDKYSRLIYSSIYHVLKLKNPRCFSQETAEDICQETFLVLSQDDFRKLKSFQGKNGCSFATWLRQVVVNFTIDYLRKEKVAFSLDQEDEGERTLKDVIPADAADALEQLIQREGFSNLKECIDGLDTSDKLLLELYLNYNLSPEELKKALRISRAAVDMRKSRIMQRLRDCFKQKGFLLDS